MSRWLNSPMEHFNLNGLCWQTVARGPCPCGCESVSVSFTYALPYGRRLGSKFKRGETVVVWQNKPIIEIGKTFIDFDKRFTHFINTFIHFINNFIRFDEPVFRITGPIFQITGPIFWIQKIGRERRVYYWGENMGHRNRKGKGVASLLRGYRRPIVPPTFFLSIFTKKIRLIRVLFLVPIFWIQKIGPVIWKIGPVIWKTGSSKSINVLMK